MINKCQAFFSNCKYFFHYPHFKLGYFPMAGISLSVHRLESTLTIMLGPAKANITPTLGIFCIITHSPSGKTNIGSANIIHLLGAIHLRGPINQLYTGTLMPFDMLPLTFDKLKSTFSSHVKKFIARRFITQNKCQGFFKFFGNIFFYKNVSILSNT